GVGWGDLRVVEGSQGDRQAGSTEAHRGLAGRGDRAVAGPPTNPVEPRTQPAARPAVDRLHRSRQIAGRRYSSVAARVFRRAGADAISGGLASRSPAVVRAPKRLGPVLAG